MNSIATVRAFNRFYTRRIGLLTGRLPDSDLTLTEGRILYEIADHPGVTAADLSRRLDIDRAQLSRTIRRFIDRGWLKRTRAKDHGKRLELKLSQAGQAAFNALEIATELDLARRLEGLSRSDHAGVQAAMHELETLLSGSASPESFTLRSIQIGDVGKVIAQQAEGYAREFGWNVEYEGLVAQILGDFVRNFDSAKDDAWIVDRAGEIAGSIFLVKDGEPGTARLRLLYLEPWARGAKLGERLVQHCVERARDLGYRRMVLWTNDVLAAARRLYERSGFRLVEEKRHHSFGKDLTAQTWLLEL